MAQIQIKSSFLIDIRQTREYSLFMQKMGWQVETIDKDCQIFIKKLPLLPFSIAKILKSQNSINFGLLKRLIKKHKILFTKIHPFTLEEKTNTKYSFDKSPLIPTKTIWVDLIKIESQLLKDMKPKTRYNIRLAQKKNLNIQIVNGNQITNSQLKSFYALWIKNKPHDIIFKPSFNELKYLIESFGNKCFFVFIYPLSLPRRQAGPPIRRAGITYYPLLATTLILTSSNMSFYWHNCSSLQGKQLFAPSLCVWQTLKESKKRGKKIFDFEGIYDERFHKSFKSWQGFTRFKQGFGGKEVEFPRPFVVK